MESKTGPLHHFLAKLSWLGLHEGLEVEFRNFSLWRLCVPWKHQGRIRAVHSFQEREKRKNRRLLK
jgi:hypothetical protein